MQLGEQLYPQRTYQAKPKGNVSYPFVYVGWNQVIPRRTSSRLIGKVHQNIEVYGTNRKEVSNMCETLLNATRAINLSTRRLRQVVNVSDKQVRVDTSTDAVLWQGIISLEFNIL